MLHNKTGFHTIERYLLFTFDQDQLFKTEQRLLMRF